MVRVYISCSYALTDSIGAAVVAFGLGTKVNYDIKKAGVLAKAKADAAKSEADKKL